MNSKRERLKILIIGASSLLGSKLYSVLSVNNEVTGTYLSKSQENYIPLNIMNLNAINALLNTILPNIVIHTVAISDPDECERNKKKAWNINVIGTKNIVKACFKYNVYLVYISTDYVFKGDKVDGYDEEDSTSPINYYGKTKAKGEQIVRTLPHSLIIRIPIIYGYNNVHDKETFVTRVIRSLNCGESLDIDDTQIRYPILIDDVAEILDQLIRIGVDGIYHISSNQPVTKYQLALKIADVFGFQKSRIRRDAKLKTLANRPLNSKLNTLKIQQLGIRAPVGINEGLLIMSAPRSVSVLVGESPTWEKVSHQPNIKLHI